MEFHLHAINKKTINLKVPMGDVNILPRVHGKNKRPHTLRTLINMDKIQFSVKFVMFFPGE